MLKKLLVLLVVPVIAACTNTEPVPFKVGKDACDHCKMTIMSNKFGMELITQKGKIYKFDDISCSVQYLQTHTGEGDALYGVDNATGKFVEASKAFYVKSEKNRTPMNSMIIAFTNIDEAQNTATSKGGEILSWEKVKLLY